MQALRCRYTIRTQEIDEIAILHPRGDHPHCWGFVRKKWAVVYNCAQQNHNVVVLASLPDLHFPPKFLKQYISNSTF